MSRSQCLFLAIVVLIGVLTQQSLTTVQSLQPGKIDVSKLGPQVGDRVPDFSLKDQNGRIQTLQTIMGPKGAMLVFVRSADWCPYCRTQLLDLQNSVDALRKKGIGLAVISYDSQDIIAAFSKQRGITYTMLSDFGSATIKKFGILNPVPDWALGPMRDNAIVQADIQKYVSVVRATPAMVGIAFPGTFMLDRQGRVTSRFFQDFYIERNTVSSVLMRTSNSSEPVNATKISTGQVEVTTYPSNPSVLPGNRFSLALDIQPHPGIHVYAPDAKGYRVISLTVNPTPFLHVLPIRFPGSEVYFFNPLNERVPVYQKAFSLVQELILDGTPETQTALKGKEALTLSGTLEYQACDATICYSPVSLPLAWTVSLKPIQRN